MAEESLRALVRSFFGTRRVYLFGSRAEGTPGRRSDFDLAIEADDDTNVPLLLARFREAVEEDPRIIYRVDIFCLEDLPVASQARIRKSGILWNNA